MARFDAPPPVVDDATQWRQARVRDVVRARDVIFELMDMVVEGLEASGLELEDVWSVRG